MASQKGLGVSQKGLRASQRGLKASRKGLRASWRGLRASWRGLRASWRGLRASWRGLRASWRGLGASHRGLIASRGGRTDVRMDERTDGRNFSPILQDFVTYRGRCPKMNQIHKQGLHFDWLSTQYINLGSQFIWGTLVYFGPQEGVKTPSQTQKTTF